MTTTQVGANVTLGVALPGPNGVAVNANGSLTVAYPELDSQITALNAQLAALAVMPPLPDYVSLLASANALVAAIAAALAVPGLPSPPSIASNIAALSASVTALAAERTSVSAQLAVIAAQLAAYALAGVDAFVFSGPRNAMGGELATALGASAAPAWGVALVTTNSATWAAMQTMFKTS